MATANDAALASALQAEFDAGASDSPALGEHSSTASTCCRVRGAPRRRLPFGAGTLFVTWNKRGAGDHLDLRGCIGCLKPLPIASLKEYALTSSLRDRRFAPMQEHEVPLLTCEVTLLTHFERAAALDDWEIGVHGVHIDYVDPRGDARTAVYLPQVMPEQGWDKPQTIDSLVRKRVAAADHRRAARRDRPHALPGDEGVARLRRLGAGAHADVAGGSRRVSAAQF